MLLNSAFLLTLLSIALAVDDPKVQKERSAKLPPCKACTVLVDSFNVAFEKTKRGKHAGGDAAWEQEKLRSYKNSEVRFVEIQEQLCTDVKRGQDHCHSQSNDHESLIEDWFIHKQDEEPDFHAWLCVKQLAVCCPPNSYGPNCKPCTECNGNGKCKGAGTRKGNGSCLCDSSYAGLNCNECAEQYYESFRDANKLLCTQCHAACGDGGCSAAGPKSCRKCKDGWLMDTENGCIDINECLEQKRACKPQQFCVNNEGSFSCLECDRSCDGCDGDGPDMCRKCADGYQLKDGKCQDVSSQQRDSYVNITRFLTYFGMCVATCVIFQSSTNIAYIVGGAVAIYIAASEYWLNTTPQGAQKPEIDTKQLEDLIMKSL
ncbi:cysteine-rich with EGF-like domain protein 2 isoform X1 [Drosophila busckii]|uniref:cysteine-rich with EGF-like domain protein 2 isoform X1 n=1 Tax=Drosophila busckii TaxID=30019 RepID=UPI00083EC1B3|nr:cysteine-rich with EGF-like domain protein 2 isoform X1 [Drosophila busckii]